MRRRPYASDRGRTPALALARGVARRPLVEGRRHGRIAGPRQHRRKPPGLELLDRPLEGIGHQRLVQVDPLVLVPGAVVVVRVDAEAVEGEQLDLLAGDVADHVDRHAAVALTGDAHLEAEPDVARLDHLRPPVVANRAPLGDGHLARLGLHLVQRGHQLRGVDLQADLLVAGASEHRRELPAQLGHRPAERIAGDRRIEHDADVRVRRIVVIVRAVVEALEPEQLPLVAVHVADYLETHALVGMVPASPPAPAPWGAPPSMSRYCRAKQTGPQEILAPPMSIEPPPFGASPRRASPDDPTVPASIAATRDASAAAGSRQAGWRRRPGAPGGEFDTTPRGHYGAFRSHSHEGERGHANLLRHRPDRPLDHPA